MDTPETKDKGVIAGGPDEKTLSDEWIIGFIEAEGSFTCDTRIYNTYPVFSLTQRNKKILEKIIKTLPIDTKVYKCKDSFYRLNFKGREKIGAMINFLDGRLRAEYSKKRFERWKEIYATAYGTPAEVGN